jgi:hypothetical protein
MDQAISAKIKKILKAKAGKAKISYKSPKQIAKQSQVVIINQDRPKRRYTRRGKATMGGGGGGSDSKIVYIPTSFPNFNIPAQNPQIIRQEMPQMIREFQPTPVYRNPLRMEPFRSALNPPPFNQNRPAPANIEGNLDEIPMPSPPPLEPEIVLEPNSIFMPSTPVSAYPIMSSSSPTQGFTQNQAVNQLNQQVGEEVKAYDDFGGYDAQAEDEARRIRLAKQLSASEMYSQPMSESESETASIKGGGGGGREEKEKRTYSGRGPSKLSQEEIMSLTSYYRAKLDKNYKNLLQSTDAGKTVFTAGSGIASAKKNNPYVKALKEDITNKYGGP